MESSKSASAIPTKIILSYLSPVFDQNGGTGLIKIIFQAADIGLLSILTLFDIIAPSDKISH